MKSLFRSAWHCRLPSAGTAGVGYWLWLAAALLLVLLTPPQVLNGRPFWSLTATGVGQGWLTAAAFLALSLFLAVLAQRPQGLRLTTAMAAVVATYGLSFWLLRLRPGLVHGWSDFALAASLGSVLAFGPYLPFRLARRVAAWALWVLLTLVVFSGFRERILGGPQHTTIETALQPLAVSVYGSLVTTEVGRGGAVEPYGDSFLLVTGIGDFYKLTWVGDTLTSTKLGLSLRIKGDARPLREDRAFAPASTRRVTDLLIDGASSPPAVYAAYQQWDVRRRCMFLRVSKSALETAVQEGSSEVDWQAVFETSPCLEGFEGLDWVEGGGRLSMLGGNLLVTVGDFGLAQAGRPGPQSSASPYGKVWIVDQRGQVRAFTRGHRNPQGLVVDGDGNAWLTEHGPQGGDELNLLKPGRNYGYPLVTYGTDYGTHSWPLSPDARDHGDFEEPVYAFQPWRAISNLIRVESTLFHSWKGDLLISSLNARSLFRVRLRGERAVYVEQIPVGFRIRDLAEGADGRLILWTDEGAVIAVGRAALAVDGVAVFGRCRSCHEMSGDASASLSLRGIVGRPVARVDGYPYSESLRRLGGEWSEERLDAFLTDPDRYAPGSFMRAGRVPDAAERRALLTFLRNYR